MEAVESRGGVREWLSADLAAAARLPLSIRSMALHVLHGELRLGDRTGPNDANRRSGDDIAQVMSFDLHA